MMTFRPYLSHEKTASVLDYKRLGKQRLEAYQIMAAMMAPLTGEVGGWTNHPVVQMWGGRPNPYIDHACGQLHLRDLLVYYHSIRDEWKRRGYKHQMDYKVLPFEFMASRTLHLEVIADHPLPWGRAQEQAHRRILLRKDSDWYGQYWKAKPRQEVV